MRIRAYRDADLEAVAAVHAEAFSRQGHSRDWIAANARAYPRTRLYVAQIDGTVRGYVAWTEKSGFRAEAVLELEQLAVAQGHRNRGIGAALICQSLAQVAEDLATRGASIKTIMVSTRAEVAATLPSLYSADEVIMVARKPV